MLESLQKKKEGFPAVDKHVPQVKTWLNDKSDKNRCFHELFTTDLERELEVEKSLFCECDLSFTNDITTV